MLTVPLLEPRQSGAERANVYALPVAVLSLLAGVISIWLAIRGSRSGRETDRVGRDLARAVRKQRQRFLDQALAVEWESRPAQVRFGDPDAGEFPEPVETLLLHWQDISGAECGSIDDIAEFYNQRTNHRLVVLGVPGAGKTVLLSRLVLDLLDRNEASTSGSQAPAGRCG